MSKSKSLTAKGIEALKAKPKRNEVADGGGLYLIIQPSGQKSWCFRYRFDRKSRKIMLGQLSIMTLAQARDKAREARDKVAKGIDPAARSIETVGDIAAMWIDKHVSRNVKPQPAAEIKRILSKEILPTLGKRGVGEVSKRDCRLLLEAVADRAPIMANRVHTTLAALFNYAVAQDILATSPTAGLKKPANEIKRDRFLKDDELRAVWQALAGIPAPFGPMIRLLILTGQRRGEVAGMRWSELDLKAKVWTLPASRSKNGDFNIVPLSDMAIGILQGVDRIGEYVFSNDGKRPIISFYRQKEQLNKLAGFDDFTLHDLRRTFRTGLSKLKVRFEVAEKLINHSIKGIASVYDIYDFADEKREAVEKWSQHVAAITGGDALAGPVVRQLHISQKLGRLGIQ